MRRDNGPFNAERYREWRKTLPFTDEQMAAQFERDADAIAATSEFLASRYRHRAQQVRKGYVSRADIRQVLNALITTCGVSGCQKRALYRVGHQGRCSTHRLVPEVKSQARRAWLDVKSREINAAVAAYDATEKSRRQAATTVKAKKRRTT